MTRTQSRAMRTKFLWLLSVVMGCIPANSQASADLVVDARALLDAGKTQEPETILRTYLADHPYSADAHFLLGYTLFRQQQATESLAEFTAGAKFRRPRADELKIVAAN